MSLRVDTSSLIAGALVCGNRGLGVLGSDIPSTGDNGAGYVYNDLSLPADASKEICGRITTWPSAGDLYAYEDTSFEFTGAPDGSYTFAYQLYVDGVSTGSPATVYLQVGSPDASFAVTTASAVFSGSAESVSPADASFTITTDNAVFYGAASTLTDSQKIDLILDILSNRQELDVSTGMYTLYADDGVTVLYTAAAWEDAAGTIPYRGRELRRLDALV